MEPQVKERRFELLPGRREYLEVCPSCGERSLCTFFDRREGKPVRSLNGEVFGKCNHINKCGFNNFPHSLISLDKWRRELERSGSPLPAPQEVNYGANINLPAQSSPRVQKVFFLKTDLEALDRVGVLDLWLAEKFGEEALKELKRRFYFGAMEVKGRMYSAFIHISPENISENGLKFNNAKLIEYKREGGALKRSGEQHAITWLHAVKSVKSPPFAAQEWTQTLFGLNQLRMFPEKVVRVVEGYRTALVCTAYFPEFVWLAADSVTGLRMYSGRYELVEPLKGREVELLPDLSPGALEMWEKDAEEMRKRGHNVEVNFTFLKIHKYLKREGCELGDIEDLLLLLGSPEEVRRGVGGA